MVGERAVRTKEVCCARISSISKPLNAPEFPAPDLPVSLLPPFDLYSPVLCAPLLPTS